MATAGFDRYAETTRRAAFLSEMERVVPWSALCGLIEPFYPKPGNGRPPIAHVAEGCGKFRFARQFARGLVGPEGKRRGHRL